MIINLIKHRLKQKKRSEEWRRKNSHNSTTCNNVFDYNSVQVGNYTYGALTVLNFGGANTLKIGSFCSIASGVVFNLAGDHHLDYLSTFPFKAKALDGVLNEAISKGNIIVEDDVWIGQNAIILSGVHIGQGAVIAAGAVVASDVSPYDIVGGVPARVIKQRFGQETIDFLLTLDYDSLTKELIEQHIDDLYLPVDDMDVKDIKTKFAWFPKKDQL